MNHDGHIRLGRDAYHAYGLTTGFRNYRGEPMPRWEDLPITIRAAWVKAATTTAATVLESIAAQVDRGSRHPLTPVMVSEMVRGHAATHTCHTPPASETGGPHS